MRKYVSNKRCPDHGGRTVGSIDCPDCMADIDEELAASLAQSEVKCPLEKEWTARFAALDELAAKAVPPELNAIADAVLAYRPKPKSKGAKRRTRRAKKLKAEDG